VISFCEDGNEYSCSTKCGKFLDWARRNWILNYIILYIILYYIIINSINGLTGLYVCYNVTSRSYLPREVTTLSHRHFIFRCLFVR
jgi:predicted nucleic acid-binding Zn ribbon protein